MSTPPGLGPLLVLWTNRSSSWKLSQTSCQEHVYCRSLWSPNQLLPFTPRVIKKWDSSPPSSQGNNCSSETQEFLLKLSTAKTGLAKALHVVLHSPSTPGVFRGLVNSSSSNCFISSMFFLAYGLKTWTISLLSLSLIDGTVNNLVSWVVNLPIEFACGLSCLWELFVITLDNVYEVVLGHNWLQHSQLETK